MPAWLSRCNDAIAACWRWLGNNKDQVTIILAVFGAVYAWNKGWGEYEERQLADQQRVAAEQRAQSARYVERYFGADFLQARTRVQNVMFNPAQYEKLMRALLADAADRTASRGSRLEKLISPDRLDSDLRTLIDIFDSAIRCVDSGTCRREDICTGFAADMLAVSNTFRPLFDGVWKRRWGVDLTLHQAEFARACKAPPAPSATASSAAGK